MSFFVPLQSEFCTVSNSIIIFSGNCIFCKLFYKNTISHVQIRAICQFITIVSWHAILVLQSNRKIKPHFPFTTIVKSRYNSCKLKTGVVLRLLKCTTISSHLTILVRGLQRTNIPKLSVYNYRILTCVTCTCKKRAQSSHSVHLQLSHVKIP